MGESPFLDRTVRPKLAIPEGLEAGLVGGLTVAAVFLIRDTMAGDPLFTPTVLGTLLLSKEAPTGSAPGYAAAYNAVHFVAWAIFGAVATRAAAAARQSPSRRALPWLVFGAAVAAFVGLDRWIAATDVGRVHLWIGGLSGLAATAGYIAWRYEPERPRSES